MRIFIQTHKNMGQFIDVDIEKELPQINGLRITEFHMTAKEYRYASRIHGQKFQDWFFRTVIIHLSWKDE